MKFRSLLLCGLMLTALPLRAAWDPSKPSTASPTRQSAEIRANWTALQETIAAPNVVADGTFLLWHAGDSSAPTAYTLAGAGATIARAGSGMPDTNRKFGLYSALVTTAAADATLGQDLLSTASYDDGFDGAPISCGAYVRAVAASVARLSIYDGAGTTYSSDHTGASTWQWLTVTRTLSASATRITPRFEVSAGTRQGWISGLTCVVGSVPPKQPQTSSWTPVTFDCFLAGNASTGTDKAGCAWNPQRPGYVVETQLRAKTAPTGAQLIVDVNTWDGAAFTSMYTNGTRPRLATSALRGSDVPTAGTYARRCFIGHHGDTLAAGGEISIDVDAVGSGVTGADLTIHVRALMLARPLEQFLGYSE